MKEVNENIDPLFGKKAKDQITGFEGIITGKSVWMYGCNQYCLTPPVDKDGKLPDGKWFDEGRLVVISSSINPESVKAKKNGADWDNMPTPR